jgi:hypothetical protein
MVHSMLRVGVLKRFLLHDAFFVLFHFSDHCAILELGYLKSGKIAYPELVRSQTFRINDLLLYIHIHLLFYLVECLVAIFKLHGHIWKVYGFKPTKNVWDNKKCLPSTVFSF